MQQAEATLPARDERRRFERIVFDPPIPATVDGVAARLLDLAPGGGQVEMDRELKVGDHVTIQFEWHGPITIHARANRVSREGTSFRAGLEFDKPPSVSLAHSITTHESEEEIARLRTLVEASKLINSSIEADALFESILSVARKELHVERGTLYFVDEKKGEIWAKIGSNLDGREIRLAIGRGIAGNVAATGEMVIMHDAYSDDRFDSTWDRASGYRTRSMLCVPIRNRDEKIVGVLQLLNKQHGSFGQRDLDFLDSISDHMAIAMENATLHLDLLEKNRMERELQLGREIQAGLLPKPPSDIDGVEIAAKNLSCYEVGGDYYDFLELPTGELGLAIGDVSGKGVSAALIMSSVQAALRMAAPIEADLTRLIGRLNGLLYRATRGRKYATFFFGRYEPESGRLRFVNAGHNPPFLCRGGSMSQLGSTGRPIGLLPDGAYEETEVMLERGSTLFLYTDGFNEAANDREDEFGMERWRDLVLRNASQDVGSLPDALLGEITRFEAGAPPTDDKTIVVLRRIE